MCSYVCFFFFKQKTAYEMRISDWSSDVCSSDLCRSDRVGDFLYGQPVTRDHRAIEFHVEHRRTADLVRLHAARSGDRLQHPHHLVGGLRHLVEIVAVELDRNVAAYA